ncbi:cyclase family protein [Aneurinibacillus thermoaerophilus]|uniref:Kynurenine formamidase n=1 Tax=Aneurinibacillus thermoaerophilus TaxID=143495 RepID=A0A1G8BDS9_ANETH|nr:cyclase family protein [Aneurinibacillus thermoaerophilus]MED0755802.1 cyclase family protein [Aneurinibacillus thermoaerophilus]MED0759550.1 cyclase family protein [Aneurinibacillus thermoaerophilus]SDH31224.1 Kynurenine formamidase [Aneurinibacillus thermoaerophilus]
MYKIYDISMPIYHGMPVYKNKEEKQPHIRVVQDFNRSSARESRIDMDMHTGTHVDSPLHMLPDGGTMADIPVERLSGFCRVLDVTEVNGGITRADLEKFQLQKDEFVLLKTYNSLTDNFTVDFVYLAEDGARYLADIGVRGVGIDALGIERDQPGHPTHKTLFEAGVIILEGLRLGEVLEGEYFMVAAPLKVLETEAAPARVLLFAGLTIKK